MRGFHRASRLIVTLATTELPASAQFGHPLKGTWSGDWGVQAAIAARTSPGNRKSSCRRS